ncbi:MAG TPA: fibrobacter succinogenes major paralogous domain-containing protein, partial [Candidatus Pacearchaeota archaeon]|nr:fibrobacter succinogenes major paralogous domain-containing protein [Candidatus Pacearchaeota archaeon]
MKQKIFVVLLAFFVISCLFTFKINTIDAEVINNDQSGSCTIQSLRNCDRDGLIRILIELLLNFIENNQQPGSVPVEPIDEQENKQEDETSGDSSFIDSRDGQGYSIVKIGNQTWMGENLRYLPSVSGPGSGSKYSPFYYVNGYTGTNVLEAKKTYNYNEYGVLYNYSAALTACPSGWHLPSDQEWYELEKHLSSGSCQYNRYGEWDCAPAGSILKESKFRALMAASRDPNGNFYNLGANTSFWSSSRYLSDALYRKININENRIYRDPASLDYGFSVRCIKGYSNQDLIKIPSINIISPKSTDTLIAGKTYTVKWESR